MKYIITTEKTITKKYLLTYEVQADELPTLDEILKLNPIDEEFFDELENEVINEVEVIEE